MTEENEKRQVLDAHGLSVFTGKLKDGTLEVGKAKSVDATGINGTIPSANLPETMPPGEHTHSAEECGIEAIDDATIEAIISGTWTPDA